ncbi:hypothetical protein BMW23_0245 [Bodo saltans virus]|uniref:Uncharacterized protein n=1 Tax=Bodo saltans virus TaxID=2024608 RepID=A0A2H4UTN0_9VIRU|nr:hypothetical protein QJ851_gp0240 [Bodo saltans virus]ATZ80303.1 hypothetical protein BMW23_0245 [Bodo saltans virus]
MKSQQSADENFKELFPQLQNKMKEAALLEEATVESIAEFEQNEKTFERLEKLLQENKLNEKCVIGILRIMSHPFLLNRDYGDEHFVNLCKIMVYYIDKTAPSNHTEWRNMLGVDDELIKYIDMDPEFKTYSREDQKIMTDTLRTLMVNQGLIAIITLCKCEKKSRELPKFMGIMLRKLKALNEIKREYVDTLSSEILDNNAPQTKSQIQQEQQPFLGSMNTLSNIQPQNQSVVSQQKNQSFVSQQSKNQSLVPQNQSVVSQQSKNQSVVPQNQSFASQQSKNQSVVPQNQSFASQLSKNQSVVPQNQSFVSQPKNQSVVSQQSQQSNQSLVSSPSTQNQNQQQNSSASSTVVNLSQTPANIRDKKNVVGTRTTLDTSIGQTGGNNSVFKSSMNKFLYKANKYMYLLDALH